MKGTRYAAKVRGVTTAGEGPYSSLTYEGSVDFVKSLIIHFSITPFSRIRMQTGNWKCLKYYEVENLFYSIVHINEHKLSTTSSKELHKKVEMHIKPLKYI